MPSEGTATERVSRMGRSAAITRTRIRLSPVYYGALPRRYPADGTAPTPKARTASLQIALRQNRTLFRNPENCSQSYGVPRAFVTLQA